MKRLVVIALPLLFFTSCTMPSSPGGSDDAVVTEEVGSAMPVPGEEVAEMMVEEDDDGEVREKGAYRPFDPTVIGNGETSVLYFMAAWCPKCRAQHAALSAAYDYPLSTSFLDYDTSLELRARYGVVQQHTFVKIDGAGEKIDMVSFPSASTLAEFLSE